MKPCSRWINKAKNVIDGLLSEWFTLGNVESWSWWPPEDEWLRFWIFYIFVLAFTSCLFDSSLLLLLANVPFLMASTHAHSPLHVSLPCYVIFKQANMTLNVSTSLATSLNVSPLWTTGILLHWLKDSYHQTPLVVFFKQPCRTLLSFLVDFTHWYWGISQPVAKYQFTWNQC